MTWLKKPTTGDRKALYLVGVMVVLVGANLLWTSNAIDRGDRQAIQAQNQAHQAGQSAEQDAIKAAIDANNRQWCDSLDLLTSGPPPTTGAENIKLFNDFKTLERRFGCAG